jgi:hypothetical protein
VRSAEERLRFYAEQFNTVEEFFRQGITAAQASLASFGPSTSKPWAFSPATIQALASIGSGSDFNSVASYSTAFTC